jgi:hypothetical protein
MQSTRYCYHFLDILLKKISSNKFHQNPSSASQVLPCGSTDLTKLIVAFRIFAKDPENERTMTFEI